MQLFGHRGAAGEAPENTIPGVRKAIAAGAVNIEIDLRLTADRQLAVLHDRSLRRTAGVKANIDEIQSSDLPHTDASKGFPGWQGERCHIPLLHELMDSAPELETVQLELKSDASTDVDALVAALLDMFPTARAARRVVATSFDDEIILLLAERAPHIRRGIVAKQKPQAALQRARELECEYLCLLYKLVLKADQPLLSSLAASDLHVSCWTVNHETDFWALREAGAHSIITDLPTTLAPLCKNQPGLA